MSLRFPTAFFQTAGLTQGEPVFYGFRHLFAFFSLFLEFFRFCSLLFGAGKRLIYRKGHFYEWIKLTG